MQTSSELLRLKLSHSIHDIGILSKSSFVVFTKKGQAEFFNVTNKLERTEVISIPNAKILKFDN